MTYIELNLLEVLWILGGGEPVFAILSADQPNSVFLILLSDSHSYFLRDVHICFGIIEIISDYFCEH
jgi:hypothetical protein